MIVYSRFQLGRRCVAASLLAACLLAPSARAGDDLTARKSEHSVSTTMDRLEGIVGKQGFTVFARVDHAAGASKVGQSLRPTQLLIFGNPKVGTALISSVQAVALDLPIRVLAWEDGDGQVWLGYTPPATLAARHGISDRDAVIARMSKALDTLTAAAAAGGKQ